MRCLKTLFALVLACLFAGCTAPSVSFVDMGHTQGGAIAPRLSDGLALNYSNAAVKLLRAKYNGARVAREVSGIAQLGLAAATGGSAAFGYGARTIALLGIGSVTVPELQKIIDAKGRAQVYQDAVRLIEEAQFDYLAHNQNPKDNLLTQNGVTLLQRTTASIHLVEKALSGTLPTIEDMQKATEPMSRRGSRETRAGDAAINHTPTDRIAAEAMAEREKNFSARVDRALAQETTVKEKVSTPELQRLRAEMEQQQRELDALRQAGRPDFKNFRARLQKADSVIPATAKETTYRDIFREIGIEDPAAVEAFKGLAVGFNGETLVETYRRFPDKQARILELIKPLEAKAPPMPPGDLPANP